MSLLTENLSDWSRSARRHLIRHATAPGEPLTVIVRGEGPYVWDDRGKRYLDALSGAFVTQVGHGRVELAEAAARQAAELAYFPLTTHVHPPAVELAERLAQAAPRDLNRVMFTCGGSESVESAWKFAKQHFRLRGKPTKHKAIGRADAYHGTTHASMAISGLPVAEQVFGPLVFGTRTVPGVNPFRPPAVPRGVSPGEWAADQIGQAIELEGPETVAAVFIEPVQAHGGALVPQPGFLPRLRRICDDHDVLLVADEVVCAFGRFGEVFGGDRYGCEPDIIVCAKGLTSGYAPLGAMIATDRLIEPFQTSGVGFLDGYTLGGQPVAAAVAMANLDILEREKLYHHVRATEAGLRATLEKLLDLPLVGDVRGDGYFYAIEVVKDKATKEQFDAEERERIFRGLLSPALDEAGIHCRIGDRESPVIVVAPPLICDQSQFDEIEAMLRSALQETWRRM